MKLIEIIEEQLLQNLKNKVQTVAQNVGNKVNSIVNKQHSQPQPVQQNLNQLQTEFNQFVEKYKNLNSDKTNVNYGFGQSSGERPDLVKNDAYNKAKIGISGKMGTTTTDGNKTITVTNITGGLVPIDEKSYGSQDQNGKITWYYAVVLTFKKSEQ
jgi:septum formation topological specificity factor MinE